jgi:hypothetical protein
MNGGKSKVNTNRPIKFTVANKIYGKKRKSDRIKRLEKYTWGIGIEHEMHIFHKPLDYTTKKIENFILVDSFEPTLRLLQAADEGRIKITVKDMELLESVPFEATGRKCNGEFVLQKAPVNMPEFITTKPISSLKTGKRSIEHYCREILEHQNRFFKLMEMDKTVKKQIKKYGPLASFPFGMSNYVAFPKNNDEIYKFDKDKSNKIKINPEYTGSYHITITLPYTKLTTDRKFIEKHQNFANQLQWLEPLLLTAFFSCDDKAVGTTQKRIRGSYRILRVGWGNLAGSDIRKFKRGIGRYSVIDSFWRDGLDFYQKDKLKPCIKPTPPAVREGGISALSSNFRTFDASKEDKHERSGAPMKKPYGMEFRIFDHFQDEYLSELCKVIVYVAENSRVHTSNKYVYKNKAWIKAVQNVMMNGWRSILDDDYINELRTILGINIKTKSKIALKVFEVINKELFTKNKNGDYTFLMLDKKYKTPPILPNINRRSWDHGFMIKLNREPKIFAKYNKFISDIPNGKNSYDDIKNIYKKHFMSEGWMRNFDDVLYFMESHERLFASKFRLYHTNSKITYIEIKNKYKKKIINFNDQINTEWYYYLTDLLGQNILQNS